MEWNTALLTEWIACLYQPSKPDRGDNYEDIADIYGIDARDLQVRISRDSDWYVIYEEQDDEVYIADLAMVNGVNSQRNETSKTDIMEQTYEIYMNLCEIMLNASENGKNIRFEATEDTSYKNVQNLVKHGIAQVLEENQREWSETGNRHEREYDDDYYDDEYYEEDEDYDNDGYEEDDDYYNDRYDEEDYNYSDENHRNHNDDNSNNQKDFEDENVENDKKIIMHDMTIKVDPEKMKEELEKIKQKLEKVRDRRNLHNPNER